MIASSPRITTAVLAQRLERSPYAYRTEVATQRHAKISRCASNHTVTLKPEFFSFLERFPTCSRSKQRELSGLLTLIPLQGNPAHAADDCSARDRRTSGTGYVGNSDSGAIAGSAPRSGPLPIARSLRAPGRSRRLLALSRSRVALRHPLISLCDGDSAPFLAWRQRTNTQPRIAARKRCAAATLEVGHA